MATSDEARLARLEALYEGMDRLVQTFGPTAGQLIQTEARVDELGRDLNDFKDWLGDVETRMRDELRATEQRQAERTSDLKKSLDALSQQLTQGLTARIGARATLTVGAIAAAAAILSALLPR